MTRNFFNGLAGLVLVAAALLSSGVEAGITYYHNDLAGSPVVATNESGQVIWRESYRPYGERITKAPASAPNDVWFTSRRQDAETGLVYMGARYYDPVLGRFISTDPVGFNEGNLHSFNRYAYANNNPYRYVDPNGKFAVPIEGLALIGIGTVLLATPEQRAQMSKSLVEGARWLQNIFNESGADSGTSGEKNSSSGEASQGTSGGARAGKPFTPKGKEEIDAENADRNGGANHCENCGQNVVPGEKAQRGVRPPGNERQRDHIIPQSKGGDGDPSNGQIFCRDCNIRKGDKSP